MTPIDSDEALEPVDILATDHERLLFYLASKVPVPIQELAEDTKQSAAVLREYFYEKLQNQVDIDSTGFVRLMDSARNPVIRASKPYIKSGQSQFDTGQSSIDQNFFDDAIDHFRRAVRIFEQIRSRLEAVNYPSEKLDQRLKNAQSSIEEAQEAIGDSVDRVNALHDGNRSAVDSNESPESTATGSGNKTRVEMLNIVGNLYERLGRVPKATDLPEECEYSHSDFYKEFGSWDKVLEAAGLSSAETATGKEKETVDGSGGNVALGPSTPIENITSHVDSVGSECISRLKSTGYTTLDDLCNVEPKEVAKHKGIGRTKSTEMVRFATENVSGTRVASSEQSKKLVSASTPSESVEATNENPDGSKTLDPATSVNEIKDSVDGVGRSSIHAVKEAGYNTLGELRDAQTSKITKYKGVGRTKALKLIRFAIENVSGNDATSGKTSNHRPSAGQSSSSSSETSSNRIQPSAMETSWETIPANERIDEPFLIRVTDVDQQVGNRKTVRLDVRDQNGREFGMDIWSKHDVRRAWREGEWYTLENARGKVWESSDGKTKKNLSSTRDLNIVELGSDFDPNAASADDTLETASEPQQQGATSDESVSGSTPDSTNSGRDTAARIDDGGSSEDVDPEVDNEGVLGDIMSDFDEI